MSSDADFGIRSPDGVRNRASGRDEQCGEPTGRWRGQRLGSGNGLERAAIAA